MRVRLPIRIFCEQPVRRVGFVFCADFWYRDEFVAPVAADSHGHFWLNFDGINWKAEVYLNGRQCWAALMVG